MQKENVGVSVAGLLAGNHHHWEYDYWGRKKEKKKGAWLPMKFLQQTHLVS